MALTGTGNVLGAALKAAVDQVVASATAAQQPVDRDAMFQAMGNAIIAHIIANGIGSIAVTGVTVGAGAAVGTIT